MRVTTVFPSRTATPMQEKVHEQEGRTYDASKWIDPAVVADTILHVLDLPDGVTIPEVTVRPVVPRPAPDRSRQRFGQTAIFVWSGIRPPSRMVVRTR